MKTLTPTTTTELLKAISKHPGIYGKAALMYINDAVKGPQYLAELYDDFKDFPEHCVDAFGYKTTFQLFGMFKNPKRL